MQNIFGKLFHSINNVAFSYLIIGLVFVLDLLTPLGYAVWILYLIPLHVAPYKSLGRNKLYLLSAVCSIMIWIGFFLDRPGIPYEIALFNRMIMTAFYWVVAFSQVQKHTAYKELSVKEKKLRKSEERFRVAQELSIDGFTIFQPKYDEQGNLVDFIFEFENDAVAKMNGTKPEDVVGRGLLELFPSAAGTPFYKIYEWALISGKTQELEEYYPGDDAAGGKWFRLVVIPTNDGIAALAQDISAYRNAEEKLRLLTKKLSIDVQNQKLLEDKLRIALTNLTENQLRFERAEQLAHVGSWVMDAATGEMQLSAEMVKLIGLPAEVKEINIHEYLKFVHPEDFQRVSTLSAEYHREGKPLDIEYRIIRPDGQTRYIRGLSSSDKMDGRINIRYGAAQDITERKLVEINLAKTQAQFIEAQRLAHIGNFSVNYQENNTVEWSAEMFRIYDRDFDKGAPAIKEAFDSIHPDDVEKVKKAIQLSKDQKKTTECVYRIITDKEKLKYLHSIFSPLFDSSGSPILMFGTSLDVTENMKQQKTIRDTLKKLQSSNKELEQFAYVASHDLQEPLRMVSSYMGMLEKKYIDQLDAQARQFIHFAVDGSKRMGSLIKDLLIYSRISSQAREFSEADMNKIYKDVVHDLQVLIKEKYALIESANLPVVRADATQMHQLLLNLIGNAIKFSGENKPEVIVSAGEVENGWMFSVRDNGIGIENIYYERIFQVFQRLHDREKYAGTGIGLAVCQKIVERHGGRIWVESEIGKGTTFYFIIAKNPDAPVYHKIEHTELYSRPVQQIKKPHNNHKQL